MIAFILKQTYFDGNRYLVLFTLDQQNFACFQESQNFLIRFVRLLLVSLFGRCSYCLLNLFSSTGSRLYVASSLSVKVNRFLFRFPGGLLCSIYLAEYTVASTDYYLYTLSH